VFIRGPQFRRALLAWFRQHGRDLPWRHTRDPYAIVVSELMLQQTQVATVIPYYIAWLRRFPDFATLAAAPESDVLDAWQGLGYYARARNLHATAKIVMTLHDGVFPSDTEAIRKLPVWGATPQMRLPRSRSINRCRSSKRIPPAASPA
jgi:A/G-specific adenine glycosylase